MIIYTLNKINLYVNKICQLIDFKNQMNILFYRGGLKKNNN